MSADIRTKMTAIEEAKEQERICNIVMAALEALDELEPKEKERRMSK
jgi:restriction endonuclease S subunit